MPALFASREQALEVLRQCIEFVERRDRTLGEKARAALAHLDGVAVRYIGPRPLTDTLHRTGEWEPGEERVIASPLADILTREHNTLWERVAAPEPDPAPAPPPPAFHPAEDGDVLLPVSDMSVKAFLEIVDAATLEELKAWRDEETANKGRTTILDRLEAEILQRQKEKGGDGA